MTGLRRTSPGEPESFVGGLVPIAEKAVREFPTTGLPEVDDEQKCREQLSDLSMSLLGKLNDTLLDRHQLALCDVWLLDQLAGSERGARPHQLAKAIMLSPTRVGKQIRGLEAKGLVARRPTRYDRRGVFVSITLEGRTRLASAMETYSHGMGPFATVVHGDSSGNSLVRRTDPDRPDDGGEREGCYQHREVSTDARTLWTRTNPCGTGGEASF